MATRRKVVFAENNGLPQLLLGTDSDPAFATAAECPLFDVVVALQYAAMIHQYNHWFAEGPAFGSLHSFFGDAYAKCIADADSVAERAVVHGEPLSVRQRLAAIVALETQFAGGSEFSCDLSLTVENHVVEVCEAAICSYEGQPNRQGVVNLLQGICDSHDQLIYMLTRITAS